MGDEATRVRATSIAMSERYVGFIMVLSAVETLSVGSVREVGSVEG